MVSKKLINVAHPREVIHTAGAGKRAGEPS